VAGAEAYLHAKFHLDPSNRLATIHQGHRQTDRTGQDRQTDRQRTDSIGRTVSYKRSPKKLSEVFCAVLCTTDVHDLRKIFGGCHCQWMAKVPNGVEKLQKISTVTDRQTTDGRAMAFTIANKQLLSGVCSITLDKMVLDMMTTACETVLSPMFGPICSQHTVVGLLARRQSFLANVNSRSRSLYAIARSSVVCLSVPCALLRRLKLSATHPRKNFTEIDPVEPLRQGS